ncbi:hypothetical protein RhiirA1_477023 [Rhizophagus irregularis]|uniref:Reverse transcriptase domain-containing protein n=1 Tax=Rhizophagus irregularis TaxID=588596 RepID=A0A2N0QU44_9GLOM|nr:hypothetical protein RhiirA1_477023 [Rhizophagus irregularis]
MDDSTLVFSSKAGMESMLSITEEFYQINNTSANHNKYVLITNLLPLTSNSTLSPVTFNLVFGLTLKAPVISSRNNSNANDYIACTIALLISTPFRLLQTQLSKLPKLSLLDGHIPLFECMLPKAFKAYYPILRK